MGFTKVIRPNNDNIIEYKIYNNEENKILKVKRNKTRRCKI